MFRVRSDRLVHRADWVDVDESYGVSGCGFSFSADRHNEGPWPTSLWRNHGAHWSPGWVRKVDDSADVDCMACIAAEAA